MASDKKEALERELSELHAKYDAPPRGHPGQAPMRRGDARPAACAEGGERAGQRPSGDAPHAARLTRPCAARVRG